MKEFLVPAIEEHLSYTDEVIFQDDSAPCHRAKSLHDTFSDLGIQRLDWPGNSPDLNPIEHLWHKMKRQVADQKPESKKMLNEFLDHVWNNENSNEIIGILVDSMSSRIGAVIAAKGGTTQY